MNWNLKYVKMHEFLKILRKTLRRVIARPFSTQIKSEFLWQNGWNWRALYKLSELSQTVKDKYHMISPLIGTQPTKEKSKQNITRDIKVKTI